LIERENGIMQKEAEFSQNTLKTTKGSKRKDLGKKESEEEID
jgi:hypothetical protein